MGLAPEFFARRPRVAGFAVLNLILGISLFGVLLLGTMATGLLVSAVKKAEDGFEDDGGYHEGLDDLA
jgi:hypothetical protein